jgi:hypothetical protein
MKILVVDLGKIYNFLVLSFYFKVVKMLKEINSTFSFEGILDFSLPNLM